MPTLKSMTVAAATLVLAALVPLTSAQAHPHVWVTAKAEVVYDKGAIVAIENHWTFDEFYTAMAIQGLDTNNDGIYSREELAELAKVNMEGLKEFDYFTFAKLGTAKVDFNAPIEAWLEHKDSLLTLHFKLPLKAPVAAGGGGFTFANYDPSSFIAFEMAKGEAVSLKDAPAGCKVAVAEVEESADNKTLAGAFSQQMGGMGGTAKSAFVTCAKP